MPTTMTLRPPTTLDAASDLEALFKRWQDGRDCDARDALVERFMPLARKLARRYKGANEPFDDLLQVASVGLILAIERFDAERGIAFSSFAVPTILGELRRYFRDRGWAVHVPRNAQERALRVQAMRTEITGREGREPSIPQLAQALEWSVEEVVQALEAAAGHHTTSLDAPRPDDDEPGAVLGDRFGTIEDGYELVESRVSVAAVMRLLPIAERRVLQMRFLDDMTQSQIGDAIGVSQMQVSRMLRHSLERLGELVEAD